MSLPASSWVIKESRSRGSSRLVALILADHAHKDGGGAYPSVPTIARETRLSDRQVQRALVNLVSLGELDIAHGVGPHGTNVYSFPLMREQSGLGVTTLSPRQDVTPQRIGVPSETPGVTPTANKGDAAVTQTVREPSENRHGELEVARARARSSPLWAEILMKDPRANWKFSDEPFIAEVERSYGDLPLATEAYLCFAWLEGPKGKKKVDIVPVWLNWLGHARQREVEVAKAGPHFAGRPTISTDPHDFKRDKW